MHISPINKYDQENMENDHDTIDAKKRELTTHLKTQNSVVVEFVVFHIPP